MNSVDRPLTFRDQNPTAMELIADHRARIAFEEEERLTQRSRQFEELRAELNSVSVRIRAWEKMHGLCFPTNPAHPILDVIASVTGIPSLRRCEKSSRHVTPGEQHRRRSLPACPTIARCDARTHMTCTDQLRISPSGPHSRTTRIRRKRHRRTLEEIGNGILEIK